MATHTQDTHPQDPNDRFTLRIEELRSVPVPRGAAGLLHKMFLELFISLLKLLAAFAEQRRNGTLPEMAPASAPEQPRAWPADLRPRESGWVEHRYPEDAYGGGTMRGRVEQPAGMPSTRRARVRKCTEQSGPASARPRYEDDGRWSWWRGPGLVWIAQAGFLRVDSKKWALAGVDNCVHFVTI